MALTSFENHTKAKMRRGFVIRKAEDRGLLNESPSWNQVCYKNGGCLEGTARWPYAYRTLGSR